MNGKDSNGQTNNAETSCPLLSSLEHEMSENMGEENKDWRQTHAILRQVINPDNKTTYFNIINKLSGVRVLSARAVGEDVIEKS